jgi:hypothetical protein
MIFVKILKSVEITIVSFLTNPLLLNSPILLVKPPYPPLIYQLSQAQFRRKFL